MSRSPASRRYTRTACSSTPGLGRTALAVSLGCLAIAGCSSGTRQAYPETFQDTSTYSRAYPASDSATCEAARRALLSQGYTIGKAQKDGVEGQKNFQVKDDEQQHQVISFHVVCTSDQQASPHTTVFVNAVQDRYIIKKTSASAGVGLSVLGSVSMPFGSYEDSLAKVSSETISAPAFYEGFFDLVQRYLPQVAAGGPASPAGKDAASPGKGAGAPVHGAAPSAAGTTDAAKAPAANGAAQAAPAGDSPGGPAPSAQPADSPSVPAPSAPAAGSSSSPTPSAPATNSSSSPAPSAPATNSSGSTTPSASPAGSADSPRPADAARPDQDPAANKAPGQ